MTQKNRYDMALQAASEDMGVAALTTALGLIKDSIISEPAYLTGEKDVHEDPAFQLVLEELARRTGVFEKRPGVRRQERLFQECVALSTINLSGERTNSPTVRPPTRPSLAVSTSPPTASEVGTAAVRDSLLAASSGSH